MTRRPILDSSRQALTMTEISLPQPRFSTRGAARRLSRRRRGAVILLFAVFLTVCVAVLALAIDLGMVANVQTDLQRSADAAALAGARDLINGRVDAIASAEE